MRNIPRAKAFDSTLAMLRDPYLYISKQCRELNSDVFQGRFMLKPAICMRGAAAAEAFSDAERFERGSAGLARIQKTLTGRGGVQGLDGAAHHHRKQMFLRILQTERVAALSEYFAHDLDDLATRWSHQVKAVLYDDMPEALTRAVCRWAFVPLAERDVHRRTYEMTAMFDACASVGLRHFLARLARRRSERWLMGVIDDVRAGRLRPPADSALYSVATHRDLQGQLLAPHIAAVELLNVLRPVVAVAAFIAQLATALAQHPECRPQLESGDDHYREMFVQEVRRLFPFHPVVTARTTHEFEWQGYRFPQGVFTVLDQHGTNHDDRRWPDPDVFRPERFRQGQGDAFDFVPQGAGEYAVNHRCPGEPATIELMKQALALLVDRIDFDVPEQDLSLDMQRVPAIPRSRFILSHVRLVAKSVEPAVAHSPHGQ